MAMQKFTNPVWMKQTLNLGREIPESDVLAIPATLYLEQPPSEAKDLARFVRTAASGADNAGLKIHLTNDAPNVQGLSATNTPGVLALNQEGGELCLGSAGSQVFVPGTLKVSQGITVGDEEIITRDREWRGKPIRLSGAITEVSVETGEPDSQATARLEEIANADGNQHLYLKIPRGVKGDKGDSGGGSITPGITDLAVDPLHVRKIGVATNAIIETDGYTDAAKGLTPIVTAGHLSAGGPTFRDYNSFWETKEFPSIMTIDLGEAVYDLRYITFAGHWRSGPPLPKAYRIEISDADNPGSKDWLQVVEVFDNENAQVIHPLTSTETQDDDRHRGTKARWVRLTLYHPQPGVPLVRIAGFQVLSIEGSALYGREPWALRRKNLSLAVSGNVGIGTTAPQAKLHVQGPVQIDGPLLVSGVITKHSGGFRIDHPLDPEHKYLSHSFVESPDMKNIYDGVVTLDDKGEAVVKLSPWFGTLNSDLRYQLTAIGEAAPNLHVAETVRDNSFTIAGGAPGMSVSWQVTGIRQDKFAQEHPIPVETEKAG